MIQPATLTTEFGDLRFVPYDADQHLPDIYRWVTQEYARFWGLNDSTVAQVDDEFKRLLALPDYQIFVGLIDDRAECLVEYYNPAHDDIGQHYPVRDGDQGMHILLSPPDQPRHGFSRAMFTAVMEHLFLHDSVRRIVVEPDLNNARIHRLNLQAGFRHVAKVNLGHKQALLGFCEREDFAHSKTCPATPDWHARLQGSPETAAAHLQPALWQEANDHLAAKLLREAIHEQLLTPQAEVDEPGHWQVTNKAGTVRYSFRATRYALDHWQVDGRSIRTNDLPQATDVMKMILALADDLGIPAANLPTYLEEIAATLAGLAWKYQHKDIPAAELAKADFQTIEAGMTEGHPVFIANNGRIGFTAADFRAYAPECGEPVKLLWLAARRSRSVFASVRGLSETDLMPQEFDLSVRLHWQQILCDQGVSPDDYLFIPVHPWQWHNKLNLAYAADRAVVKGTDPLLRLVVVRPFTQQDQILAGKIGGVGQVELVMPLPGVNRNEQVVIGGHQIRQPVIDGRSHSHVIRRQPTHKAHVEHRQCGFDVTAPRHRAVVKGADGLLRLVAVWPFTEQDQILAGKVGGVGQVEFVVPLPGVNRDEQGVIG